MSHLSLRENMVVLLQHHRLWEKGYSMHFSGERCSARIGSQVLCLSVCLHMHLYYLCRSLEAFFHAPCFVRNGLDWYHYYRKR